VVAVEGASVPVNFILGAVGEPDEALPEIDAENDEIARRAREEMLGAVEPSAETGEASADAPPKPRRRVRATPAARRLAREHKLDLAAVAEALDVSGAVNEAQVKEYLARPSSVPVAPDAPHETASGGIAGIGVDMIEISRVRELIEQRGDSFIKRTFTEEEIAYCGRFRNAAEHYAGRFAVKEAVFKALGTGWSQGVSWLQVETVCAESGAPEVRLSGRAAERAAAQGMRRAHVSISHTRDNAIAYVVLEK
jgi:holo-[acyl-carrier protein] synthase